MASGKSRLLVIDTSVAGAAGRYNTKPPSKPCRDFLTAVLEICHHIVITPDLREEWNRHQTEFVSEWCGTMIAKKKFHFIRPDENKALRDKIEESATNALAVKAGRISPKSLSQLKEDAPNEQALEAMLKDLRLLEAAMATDRIVVSLDNSVRNLFAAATEQIQEIKDIVWINPNENSAQVIIWLEKGAIAQRAVQLTAIFQAL